MINPNISCNCSFDTSLLWTIDAKSPKSPIMVRKPQNATAIAINPKSPGDKCRTITIVIAQDNTWEIALALPTHVKDFNTFLPSPDSTILN